MRRSMAKLVAAGASATVVAGSITGLVVGPTAAVDVSPNPKVAEACEMDFSLMLDASGSISSAKAVEKVRGAATTFVNALAGSKSTLRLEQFATATSVLASRHEVNAANVAGVFATGLKAYYDPKPPVPAGTFEYNGKTPWTKESNWSKKPSAQWTNLGCWARGLAQRSHTASDRDLRDRR